MALFWGRKEKEIEYGKKTYNVTCDMELVVQYRNYERFNSVTGCTYYDVYEGDEITIVTSPDVVEPDRIESISINGEEVYKEEGYYICVDGDDLRIEHIYEFLE